MNGEVDTISKHFRGFQSPNTTPVPDEVFDELMYDLTGAELKVLLYICRRTFGWKKESDTISLKQMTQGIQRKNGTWLDRGTGLAKDSVTRVVKSLEERGVILRNRRSSQAKGNEATTYALNMIPLSDFRTRVGDKIGQGGIVKSDKRQETLLQETIDKTVKNGNVSLLQKLPDLVQPQERAEYMTNLLTQQLEDTHSIPFYRLVAAKVSERLIRQALAEIKADGAREPAKLFTHKMKLYTLQQLKERVGE